MNKDFLNALDDWGTILTDTYEKNIDAYTFKFSYEYPMHEYKIRHWDKSYHNWDKSPGGYQSIAMTEKVIDTLDSITLINTSNKKYFRVRKHYGGNEGDQIYKITTKLTNVLINGKTVLDWFFMDPNVDKNAMINLVAGFSAYMKLYKEYEDITVNIFINHMANDKIIISSNGLFNTDYEIENNLDLIEFENRFKK